MQIHPLLNQQSLIFKPASKTLNVATNIQPFFPKLLQSDYGLIQAQSGKGGAIKKKRVGVCYSGGPAPGGHNVVIAMLHACRDHHELVGINGGMGGLLTGKVTPLTEKECKGYLNTGGFDLLGTDRTKIKSDDHYKQVIAQVRKHQLDGLVIIGGDDSNTNAAFLAEALYDEGCCVVGVPKTIDGDLRFPPYLPISFGFDTAVSVYAALVKNLIKDTKSVKKYWHIVKLMGRHAGHITQEVCKRSSPDMMIIGEYLKRDNTSLMGLVKQIGDVILNSSEKGKDYGVICFAEGILEWMPDMIAMIESLSIALSKPHQNQSLSALKLPANHQNLWLSLPHYIQSQLCMDRDEHGNIALSRIETERLLIQLVNRYISEQNPRYHLNAMPHFFGYEGRCADPSPWDASYCYNLGHIAMHLVLQRKTGMMAACTGFGTSDAIYGIPLASLLSIENRLGKQEPVIQKVIVSI